MTWRAGSWSLVGDQEGGLVVAEAGDGELAEGAGVGGQGGGGVVVDFDAAGPPPARPRVMGVQALAGRAASAW